MYLKSGECPLLTDEVLTRLRHSGVSTVLAFLSRDPETLVHICSLTYKEVLSVKKVLIAKYSALQSTGDALLNTFTPPPISLGCDNVDRVLDGGLWAGELVELCGPSAVGKSQLCMSAAVSAVCGGAGALYVDTKGDFSADRCRQILQQRGYGNVEDELLSRLQSCSCDTVYDLLAVLELVRNKRRLHSTLRLLVVDSLTSVIAPMLSAPGFIGLGLLNDVGITLRSLAVDCHLTALVTNHTVHGEPGTEPAVRPALGTAWLSVPHARLLLQHQPTASHSAGPAQLHHPGPIKSAELVKSVRAPCGRSTKFEITAGGVSSVSERAETCSAKRKTPDDD